MATPTVLHSKTAIQTDEALPHITLLFNKFRSRRKTYIFIIQARGTCATAQAKPHRLTATWYRPRISTTNPSTPCRGPLMTRTLSFNCKGRSTIPPSRMDLSSTRWKSSICLSGTTIMRCVAQSTMNSIGSPYSVTRAQASSLTAFKKTRFGANGFSAILCRAPRSPDLEERTVSVGT